MHYYIFFKVKLSADGLISMDSKSKYCDFIAFYKSRFSRTLCIVQAFMYTNIPQSMNIAQGRQY